MPKKYIKKIKTDVKKNIALFTEQLYKEKKITELSYKVARSQCKYKKGAALYGFECFVAIKNADLDYFIEKINQIRLLTDITKENK